MFEGTIIVPSRVKISTRKYFVLNLNAYRNAHYFTLNKAKKLFEDEVSTKLEGIPKLYSVQLTYIIHPNTKRLFDVSNVGSIVDKFFSDTLVRNKIITDDNYGILPTVTYSMGTIVKGEPYVEINIKGRTNEDPA